MFNISGRVRALVCYALRELKELMFQLSKTKIVLLALLTLSLVLSSHTYAQDGRLQTPRIVGEPGGYSGYACETIMAELDFIAIAANELGRVETVIIIARLGNGERSRSLIRLRLRQVADYLNRRLSTDRIITAEGSRTHGLGQIEFYVGGKLHTVIKVKRNRDLVKGCDSG